MEYVADMSGIGSGVDGAAITLPDCCAPKEEVAESGARSTNESAALVHREKTRQRNESEVMDLRDWVGGVGRD